jgi:hypothetical protein
MEAGDSWRVCMGRAPGVTADGICRVVKDSAILFALRDDGGSCLWPQVHVSGKEQAADRVNFRSDGVQERV